MPLDTLIFDASPCRFPSPRVPPLPVGLAGVSLQTTPRWAPAEHFRHFARGRYALCEAYRLAGVGPEGALLAPSYHCRTMLDPALALGGEVRLYPLQADLSPDLSALDALLDQTPPVKALLAAHFFGLPRDFAALAAWCADHGITLIEDASHAFFTEQHRPPGIGGHGEFVISSPYKFLPSLEGGLLYARDASRLAGTIPAAPRWRDELRGLARLAQKASRRAQDDIATLAAKLRARSSESFVPAVERREFAGPSPEYQPAHAHLASLRCSRLIYRHPDISAITRRRRAQYRLWVQATMALPYCHPLYPALPEECIPYMFPLLIDRPNPHFYWLKHLGVPIYRWDSLAVSGCRVAQHYRLHLIHLPCHQSLRRAELEWVTEAIRLLGGIVR